MPENIDIKDLYKRLPFLEKTIREEDRKIIEVYVIEKVGNLHRSRYAKYLSVKIVNIS